jgi:hypothetical protein
LGGEAIQDATRLAPPLLCRKTRDGVLEGDEETIYAHSHHNGVSCILRVALELSKTIEGG